LVYFIIEQTTSYGDELVDIYIIQWFCYCM